MSISRKWIFIGAIVLVTIAVYSNVYHVPFVFDDIRHISDSAYIRDVANYLSFDTISRTREIVDLTFALNYRFGGINVVGYHIVNIVIHGVNGILVYFLALSILRCLFPSWAETNKGEPKGKKAKKQNTTGGAASPVNGFSFPISLAAFFAALIFVAHPLQTQAVTYIIQRYTSLIAFFYMASVLSYVKGRESMRRGSPNALSGGLGYRTTGLFILSAICGVLAFLCKQSAASLPGAIILVEYVCFGGTRKEWVRKLFWMVPVFILFEIFVLYSSGLFAGSESADIINGISDLTRETPQVTRWRYLCTQFNVLVIYLRLLICPINQNLDYVYVFKKGFLDGLTPFAFTFLVGLVLFAFWKRKKYPVFAMAVWWYFITLSVESSFVPIRDALFEHRLYLPMFGFALFVSWFVFYVFQRKRTWAVVVCIALVTLLGTASYLRNGVWRDRVTLWTDVVEKAPHNVYAYYNLGLAYADEGRTDRAVQYYEKALSMQPKMQRPRYHLGVIYSQRGDLEKAVMYLTQYLEAHPRNVLAHVNLGITLAKKGDYEAAYRHFRQALDIAPHHVSALYNWGVTLEMQGRMEEAVDRYKKAVEIDPDYAKAQDRLERISTVLTGSHLKY